MPAVSTNVGRGGGDGDREQILVIVEKESDLQECRIIWSVAQNYLNYMWENLGARFMSRTLTAAYTNQVRIKSLRTVVIVDISTLGYIKDLGQYSTESSDSLDSKTY